VGATSEKKRRGMLAEQMDEIDLNNFSSAGFEEMNKSIAVCVLDVCFREKGLIPNAQRRTAHFIGKDTSDARLPGPA